MVRLKQGFPNLAHHIASLRNFGVPVVVAINYFPADKPEELEQIAAECARLIESPAPLSKPSLKAARAQPIGPNRHRHHRRESRARRASRLRARRIARRKNLSRSPPASTEPQAFPSARRPAPSFDRFTEWGFGALPVCIAKTQYSLTDNPKIFGAPTGWTLNITDASLSAGAGFIVAVAGNMMLMPGLPSKPRALSIDVDEDGNHRWRLTLYRLVREQGAPSNALFALDGAPLTSIKQALVSAQMAIET